MYMVFTSFLSTLHAFLRVFSRYFSAGEPNPSFLEHEQDVVVMAQQGNGQAFSQLYEHYFPQIYAFIMRRCGHQQLTEDLTSQVFLKAFKNLRDYQPRGYTFGAWVYRIATNALMDHYRKASTRSEHPTDELPERADQSRLAHEEIESEQQRQELLSLVDRLNEKDKHIITLKFFAELSVKEIAKVVSLSPNAVSVRIYRALDTLRQHAERTEVVS
jgi:RNA polymerase sigma-70 factor, ECF subfamily